MSNESLLIANDLPGPVGADDDGNQVGYGLKTVSVASGPHAVPVCWLSLFNRSHLLTLEMPQEEQVDMIPSLVAKKDDAKRLLLDRRDLFAETFPEFRTTWDQFAKVIERLKSRYIKVDLQELWFMEPEEFVPKLEGALRWFDTRSDDDFRLLLRVASIIDYDKARRTFSAVSPDVPRAFHLRGYANNDSSWDDTSDT